MDIDLKLVLIAFLIGLSLYLLVNIVFKIEGYAEGSKQLSPSCSTELENLCGDERNDIFRCAACAGENKDDLYSAGCDRDNEGITHWCVNTSPSPSPSPSPSLSPSGECVCAFETDQSTCIDYASPTGLNFRHKEICNRRNKDNCYFDENTSYVGEGTCIWKTPSTKIPPEIDDCEKITIGQCYGLNESGYNQCTPIEGPELGGCVPRTKYNNDHKCTFDESCASGYCESGYCKQKK